MQVKNWVLIFSLLVCGIANAQTSGGGPFTHGQTLSLTYNGGSPCYPYQIAASSSTASIYSCVGGIATLPLGSGGSSGGSGTVTNMSVVSANGFTGTVANATTTPAVTLNCSVTGILKGNGTAIGAATADTDYTTPTGTETLTNKKIQKRVTTYSTATSITPDTDTDDISYMANTQGAGTFNVNADSGVGQSNGQSWVLKINSTSVQTFSWNGLYVGGTLGLPQATLGTSTTQYFAFIWDSVNSKWDYTGSVGGF